MTKLLLALGYLWALPFTLVGLVLTLAAGLPREFSFFDGVLEVVPRKIFGGGWISGQTWGWLVLYCDAETRRKATVRVHERRHIRDNFWMGPFFYLLYGAQYVWLRLARHLDHRNAYYALWLEKRAYGFQDKFDRGERPGAWGSKLPAAKVA